MDIVKAIKITFDKGMALAYKFTKKNIFVK